MKLKKYENIISIESENYKAKIVIDISDFKNSDRMMDIMKKNFNTTIENTKNLSENEQFDMVLQNFFEKIPSKISDMNYEPFTNILPSIIGLNYNLSVTTNLNTAQCTYNNGKIDITMDDNCRNNIIIKADNFIKECEFEHKGFLSYRFRIKAIKTMTKMSNKVPQLSKITYDIGNKIANFENE